MDSNPPSLHVSLHKPNEPCFSCSASIQIVTKVNFFCSSDRLRLYLSNALFPVESHMHPVSVGQAANSLWSMKHTDYKAMWIVNHSG